MGRRRRSSSGLKAAAGPMPSPAAARRRQLRQRRRAERWRNLWRLVLFSAISAALTKLLLRQGWTLGELSQVEVSGSRMVSRAEVLQAAGLPLPLPLLELHPQLLARRLAASLPVEQVRISRWMLPPRLRIELVDRQAVARAERAGPHGPEPGWIDRLGNWIEQPRNSQIRIQPLTDLVVLGWSPGQQTVVAQVLEHRQHIGAGLREMRFDSDGSLWLTTRELGPMRLGPADGRLSRRLEVAGHLNRILPARIQGRRLQLIDLSDPEHPELSLPASPPPPGPRPAAGSRSGRTAPPTTGEGQ